MSRTVYQGYVIHRRPYRETSLIVDFFTAEQGRVSAVAKGARANVKSLRKSALQPLQLIEFECVGRGLLKNLGRVDTVHTPIQISGRSLYAVFYINELLLRALPESEEITELFDAYQEALLALHQLDAIDNKRLEPVLRRFEMILLSSLGHLPDLSCDCQTGEPLVAQEHYQYMPERGLVRQNQPDKYSLKGSLMNDILHLNFVPETLAAAKFICRQTLPLAIGDKPIKSRELFS